MKLLIEYNGNKQHIEITHPKEFFIEELNLNLEEALTWYVEDYPNMPSSSNIIKAEIIMRTLRKWSLEFKALPDKFKIVPEDFIILSLPLEAIFQNLGIDISISSSVSYETSVDSSCINILYVLSRDFGDIDLKSPSFELFSLIHNENINVNLDVLRPATYENFKEKIKLKDYHIVHFDGHGDICKLYFADGGVDAYDFAKIIAQNKVPYVIMNACRSSLSDEDGNSVTSYLLKEGVLGVLGTPYLLKNDITQYFFRVFYKNLFIIGELKEALKKTNKILNEDNKFNTSENSEKKFEYNTWILFHSYTNSQYKLPQVKRGLLEESHNRFFYKNSHNNYFIEIELALLDNEVEIINIYGMLDIDNCDFIDNFNLWFSKTGGTLNTKIILNNFEIDGAYNINILDSSRSIFSKEDFLNVDKTVLNLIALNIGYFYLEYIEEMLFHLNFDMEELKPSIDILLKRGAIFFLQKENIYIIDPILRTFQFNLTKEEEDVFLLIIEKVAKTTLFLHFDEFQDEKYIHIDMNYMIKTFDYCYVNYRSYNCIYCRFCSIVHSYPSNIHISREIISLYAKEFESENILLPEAFILLNIASNFEHDFKNYEKSLEFITKAHEIAMKTKNNTLINMSLFQKANIFVSIEDERALDIYKEIKNNIINGHFKANSYFESILDSNIDIAEKIINNNSNMKNINKNLTEYVLDEETKAEDYFTLGLNALEQDIHQEARFCFNAAMEIYKKEDNFKNMIEIDICFAILCIKEGDFNNAINYFSDAFQVLNKFKHNIILSFELSYFIWENMNVRLNEMEGIEDFTEIPSGILEIYTKAYEDLIERVDKASKISEEIRKNDYITLNLAAISF